MIDRLEACYFGGASWDRLAHVLRHTARVHCSGWAVNVERITPQQRQSPLGVPGHVHNTQKLDWWAGRVVAAADGDRLLLIDADTMIMRPLNDVWDRDFSFAYTTKPSGSRYPFNGGVIFVRVDEASRRFFAEWHRENLRLLRNPVEHQAWRAVYGGCNQAALGSLLERMTWRSLCRDINEARLGDVRVRVARLPCAEWNCEDTSWRTADLSQVRIVHVKSHLQLTVFRQNGSDKSLLPLADLWRRFEREAGAAEAKSA